MKPWHLLFPGMGNLMDSMKKAQEIAKQAEVINKELMGTVVVGNGKFMNNEWVRWPPSNSSIMTHLHVPRPNSASIRNI